ncbi:MAG: hypothetical protein K1566_16895 [Candidatus Thiodiazotropha sp. (ex. Lucinisca nassula)]|nr:hypothetical protein [Candidatus Thiodiazotropha sp. (ex. Lucinisca nassula)]
MKKSGHQFILFADLDEFETSGFEALDIPEFDVSGIEPFSQEFLAELEAAGKELMDSLEPFTFDTGEINEN